MLVVQLTSSELAKWNAFKVSAKAAGVGDADVAKVLAAAPNFGTLAPLLAKFVDPALGFNGKGEVASFLSSHKPAPPPTVSTPSGSSSTAPASAPKKTVWGTPAVAPTKPPAPLTVPRLGAASADDEPGALTAEHAVQDWDGLVAVLKKTSKPSDVSKVKANKMLSTSGETREAEMLISFTDGSNYKFVLHFHPSPTNGNFLHFKNSQSATTNFKLSDWNHWAIKAAGIKAEKFKTGKLV
jgi:hypothetical protein